MTENDLPEGRLTNKDVAQYVALQLKDARDEIREEAEAQQKTLRGWIEAYIGTRIDAFRDSLGGDQKRFRIEMRAWLAGAVMLNALHPAGVATSIFGALGSVLGVHALARLFNR